MIAAAFANMFSTFAGTVFDPIDPKDPAIRRMLGGGARTEAGVEVNEETVLKCAPFWRGVNLICNYMAKVPLFVIRSTGDGKERFKKHPAYRLLRNQANDEQAAGQFRRQVMGHALTWGNGYAWIERDEAGRPLSMLPLLPDVTKPVRDKSGELLYRTKIGGQTRFFLAENILHIRGLSWDGMAGYNPTENGAESLGVGIAARQFGARFFGSGATASGVLIAPTGLNEDEEKRLKSSFEEAHAGLSKSHKVILLEDGAKFQQLTIPPENAQFLESREFDLLEVANWLGLPPHKLGHPGRTSYNSLEQENQAFLDDSIDPWFCIWEEEIRQKLFTEEEKQSDEVAAEFLRESLRRVDLKAETESLIMELNNGGLNLDEYRRIKNRPMLPDGLGKRFRRPANIGIEGEEQVTGAGTPPAAPPSAPAAPPPTQQRGEVVGVVVRDGVKRTCARLGNQCRRAGKDGAAFCKWVDELAASEATPLADILTPAAAVLGCEAAQLAKIALDRVSIDGQEVAKTASAATIKAAAEALATKIESEVCEGLATQFLTEIAPQ